VTTTVRSVSQTQPVTPVPGVSTPGSTGRLGPLFAGIWLFFLLNPLLEGWAHRDEKLGVLGIVCTLAFATVYMALWVRARADRQRLVDTPPLSWSLPYLGALVLLGALTVACVGEPGMACTVYVSVACVMVFPFRVAAPIVVSLVVGTIALGAREDWGSQVGTAFGIMAASVAVFGLRAVMTRSIDLVNAQLENSRLAVDNERTRFARDLHDILGHSLTVITVKAELAQKLLDVDLERARAELADLERLSRDALTDVRRAVEGYRDITLPGELVRARVALRAAEIDAELPNSTDDVPSELRELFAWTVREGVTNVIRHSGAKHCSVLLSATTAEVRDDGDAAPSPNGQGSGLAGLRERAAEVGATVITRELSPGFSLSVVRS
jgi:two-component system sensor histidine kinase DesK